MKEVDFDFLIEYLSGEIATLSNASKMVMPDGKTSDSGGSLTSGMVEYLTNLLGWVKSAVRLEREKIQGAKEYIDATLYALMSKSSVKLDDEYKRMLDHVKSNACKNFDDSEIPEKEKPPKSYYISMAERLEHMRLELAARNAENAVRKRQYIHQDMILAEASDMLRDIGSGKI